MKNYDLKDVKLGDLISILQSLEKKHGSDYPVLIEEWDEDEWLLSSINIIEVAFIHDEEGDYIGISNFIRKEL